MIKKMTFLAFFVFLSLLRQISAAEKKWKCTDEFCQKIICPEFPPDCWNKSKAVLVPSTGPCNCCNHCFLFQAEGKDCSKLNIGLPNYICEPGHTCNDERKCEKRIQASGHLQGEDPHFFKNYVCKNGKCRCAVLTDDGQLKYVFGKFSESEMNKNETQCGCSVVAYKAMNQPLRALPFEGVYQPSVRCMANGQFDPLQCVEGRCGCVEKDTGTPDKNGFKYSVRTLERGHPACFDPARHKRGKYYTECEKMRNQVMQEMNQGFWQDVNLIHFRSVNCNPDGTWVEEGQRL